MEQIQMRSIGQCTIVEITELWNLGFQLEFSNEVYRSWQCMARFQTHHIHPELSVAAYLDGKPVGFVLIGWKDVKGRKLAWNGGTGVVPAYRGHGLSKPLLNEVIHRVQQAGAESLTLEVMEGNTRAFRAYHSCGFYEIDQLVILQRKGNFDRLPFRLSRFQGFVSVRGLPERVQDLNFYNERLSSWTTQWFNLSHGMSYIVYDRFGHAAGYALFQENYDASGLLTSIILYHCEANPNHEDKLELINFMLSEIMRPELDNVTRKVHYLRESNRETMALLSSAGFKLMKREHLMTLDFNHPDHSIES